jgi:thymidylate kinase
MRVIILDGIDRTGKDSVKEEIIRQTNGNVIVFVRGFISQIAYSEIFDRDVDEIELFTQMKSFQKNEFVEYVYLYASEQEIQRRCLETKEKPFDIGYHLQVFNDVVDKCFADVRKIDTTSKTIQQVAKEALN